MTPNPTDLRRAKAIWEAAFPTKPWDSVSGEARAEVLKSAAAIRASDEAAGMVLTDENTIIPLVNDVTDFLLYGGDEQRDNLRETLKVARAILAAHGGEDG